MDAEAEALRRAQLMPRRVGQRIFLMKSGAMFPLSTHGGHSAQVKMQLLVGGQSLPLSQMGSDFVLVVAPANHPPADARMVLPVDQSERSWDVHLTNGISAGTKRVTIAARA